MKDIPHLKGKYKGKSGKIDVMEDYIGTEELSGTYEGRKHNWKVIKREKLIRKDIENKAIEAFRKKREDELRAVLVDQGYVEDVNQKIGTLLTWVLMPDAFRYMCMIYATEPKIGQEMMTHLMAPMDVNRLDEYLDAIRTRGHGPKKRITLTTIVKLERKIKKIKGKILVEREGKRTEIKEMYKRET